MKTKLPSAPDFQGKPVASFPITFSWFGALTDVFNKQVDLLHDDLMRAHAADKMIVYLSCPISPRAGGFTETNVDIAQFTARRLMQEWGENVFILNPTNYQLDSKEGTGMFKRHLESMPDPKPAMEDIEALNNSGKLGGDYLRMWTRVLVEDRGLKDEKRANLNLGALFDAYYFIGPSDMRRFFLQGGATNLSAAIEGYLARKIVTDEDFRDRFDPISVTAGRPPSISMLRASPDWEKLRKDFLRFYLFRAGVFYSKGSHDEWNIWCRLNKLRSKADKSLYDFGDWITGFYDGVQVDPASALQETSRGYEVP